MTESLRAETCTRCHTRLPWQWVPPVIVQGRTLSGTDIMQTPLIDGICSTCHDAREQDNHKSAKDEQHKQNLVQRLGGAKPYRDFLFETFDVVVRNRLAFDRAQAFGQTPFNLYLWGPCGVGKTHLASAAARTCFDGGQNFEIVMPAQLTRKTRMREPDAEQAAIDHFARVPILVLDDLGLGSETPYFRQVLREILDMRQNEDRQGLIVTSPYSPPALSEKMNDDTILSRIFGMCDVVEINGKDHRLSRR